MRPYSTKKNKYLCNFCKRQFLEINSVLASIRIIVLLIKRLQCLCFSKKLSTYVRLLQMSREIHDSNVTQESEIHTLIDWKGTLIPRNWTGKDNC